jgi:hypothetical protein
LRLALDEKVSALETVLRKAGLPHAFGGAIALAYYATPRGTHDVDVNLFVPASDFDRVLAALAPLRIDPPTPAMRRALERDEQVRMFWDGTPLDLFFSYTALHAACEERRRRVAFGSEKITILSSEDLAIFKVLFDREKDWSDLRELLFAQGEGFDAKYALDWLDRVVGHDDPRLLRFREMSERQGG